jgi:hypothetical protein
MSLRVTLNKAIKPSADMFRDDFKKAIFAGKIHSLLTYVYGKYLSTKQLNESGDGNHKE